MNHARKLIGLSIAQHSAGAKRHAAGTSGLLGALLLVACAHAPAPSDCSGNRYLGSAQVVGHCSEDTDADGIPDWLDRCPDSASPQVDRHGCELTNPVAPLCDGSGCRPQPQTWIIRDLPRDQPELNRQALSALDEVVQRLRAEPKQVALIEGHTDALGSATHNYRLGLARALQVRSAMIEAGIAEHRLSVISRGESRPLSPNNSPEQRRRNRRVEVIVGETFDTLLPPAAACDRAVDGDCDGVADALDRCPSSPPLLAVTAQGCLREYDDVQPADPTR